MLIRRWATGGTGSPGQADGRSTQGPEARRSSVPGSGRGRLLTLARGRADDNRGVRRGFHGGSDADTLGLGAWARARGSPLVDGGAETVVGPRGRAARRAGGSSENDAGEASGVRESCPAR